MIRMIKEAIQRYYSETRDYKMNYIKTIDLWTEQHNNHCECFNGAFVDGLKNSKAPFDIYKIIKNCNCMICV